jgi:hypothetical protein
MVDIRISGGIQYSTSEGESYGEYILADINGDGLADYVENGNVRLGTGYNYQAETGMGLPSAISRGTVESTSKTAGAGIGTGAGGTTVTATTSNTNMLHMGVAAGISQGTSINYNTRMMLDINGDGLPDIVSKSGNSISVRYNKGKGFTAPYTV